MAANCPRNPGPLQVGRRLVCVNLDGSAPLTGLRGHRDHGPGAMLRNHALRDHRKGRLAEDSLLQRAVMSWRPEVAIMLPVLGGFERLQVIKSKSDYPFDG